MIGWLNGKPIDTWQKGIKKFVLISCNSIGYEVQLLPRSHQLINEQLDISLWIHQVYREEEIILFGFHEKSERNFFRKLIEVNGIGPQIAISLLDMYKFNELLVAIQNKDIKKLTNASGIGKRIAERLVIELQGKLNEFDEVIIKSEEDIGYFDKEDRNYENKEELKTILKDLNYEEVEIIKAINAIYKRNPLADSPKEDFDSYLKEALVWLSQDLSRKGS
tara:strand:+ start:3464 stop:4126 length:663 start_codon:yes stop_codon:yes gene_type:complete